MSWQIIELTLMGNKRVRVFVMHRDGSLMHGFTSIAKARHSFLIGSWVARDWLPKKMQNGKYL